MYPFALACLHNAPQKDFNKSETHVWKYTFNIFKSGLFAFQPLILAIVGIGFMILSMALIIRGWIVGE